VTVLQLSITITPEFEAIPTLRRFVALAIGLLACPSDRDTAELLTTELASNAINVDAGEVTVVLKTTAENRLHVDVRDHGYGLPELAEPDSDDAADPNDPETPRGLAIVDQLAAQWGVDQFLPGKNVWFEIDSASEFESPKSTVASTVAESDSSPPSPATRKRR
jgi:anti-sigma regulatory factor (Ser/Thr protein kinase)